MSDSKWDSFQRELTSLITTLGGTIWVRNSGVGLWEGVNEDNYVVLSWMPLSQTNVLRGLVSLLGSRYQQQAIAILVGNSETLPCVADMSFVSSSISTGDVKNARHTPLVGSLQSGGGETPDSSGADRILISSRFIFESE